MDSRPGFEPDISQQRYRYARMVETSNSRKIVEGKPLGRVILDENTKMDARETDCEDWIRTELVQDRVQCRVLLKLWDLLPVS